MFQVRRRRRRRRACVPALPGKPSELSRGDPLIKQEKQRSSKLGETPTWQLRANHPGALTLLIPSTANCVEIKCQNGGLPILLTAGKGSHSESAWSGLGRGCAELPSATISESRRMSRCDSTAMWKLHLQAMFTLQTTSCVPLCLYDRSILARTIGTPLP